MIPDDLMSSKNTNKAELRISPQREKRNKELIHLLKPTDILEREREGVKSFVTKCISIVTTTTWYFVHRNAAGNANRLYVSNSRVIHCSTGY